MDPLERNMNGDYNINTVEVKTKLTKQLIKFKSGAYADDIAVIYKSYLLCGFIGWFLTGLCLYMS